MRPETPIIFGKNFICKPSILDKEMDANIKKFNRALKAQYAKMIEGRFDNIFYVNTENAAGDDHEV